MTAFMSVSGNSQRKVPELFPEPITGISQNRAERETRTPRALLAGTNPKYVPLADKILERAPDLAERVERGELTLKQARIADWRKRPKPAAMLGWTSHERRQ